MKDLGYRIEFGEVRQELIKFLSIKAYSEVFVLVDETTAKLCYPIISEVLPDHTLIEIKAGEENKNLENCIKIWKALTECYGDRNALMINLGGGMITDLGGFCASTYKRGIKFINLPTTLLAQVDASVGGKTGIDFMNFKNQIGIFSNPECVIIDYQFLDTLEDRQILSGLAEVIKHGLIKDNTIFESLSLDGPIQNYEVIVKKAIQVKSEIVISDYYESGERKKLNFGHTIGHALETFYLKKSNVLLHGEAVLLGMVVEADISRMLRLISDLDFHKIFDVKRNLYSHLNVKDMDLSSVLELIKQDKKNIGGDINFTLLSGIGSSVINQKVSNELILKSLQNLKDENY